MTDDGSTAGLIVVGVPLAACAGAGALFVGAGLLWFMCGAALYGLDVLGWAVLASLFPF